MSNSGTTAAVERAGRGGGDDAILGGRAMGGGAGDGPFIGPDGWADEGKEMLGTRGRPRVRGRPGLPEAEPLKG